MPEHQAERDLPAPDWPTCDHVESGKICIGKRVDGFDCCMAHISDEQVSQTLAQLHPGASVDMPGTPIDARLLSRILRALAGNDRYPVFGRASFIKAHFSEDADFSHAIFGEDVSFDHATFEGDAKFTASRFSANARFSRAQFTKEALFANAAFGGATSFGRARFNDRAIFRNARFSRSAIFGNAQFSRSTNFSDTHFGETARFVGAQFQDRVWFIAARFNESVRFENAEFAAVARFYGAQFTGMAVFGHVQFRATAAFTEANFGGITGFDNVQFNGAAVIRNVKFGGRTKFDGSHFTGDAVLDGARFQGDVSFDRTEFSNDTMLRGAQFVSNASFKRADFRGGVTFDKAQFTLDAAFNGTHFRNSASFDRVRFHRRAVFDDTNFEKAIFLGPLAASSLSFRRAVFSSPLQIDAAAADVSCRDTAWRAGVTLRLRYATVDLERATFTVPSFVGGADHKFDSASGILSDDYIRMQVAAARIESPDLWVPVLISMQGADAFNLSVTDVDLSQCRFAGARVLDQLRLEGRCIFDRPPNGVRRGWAWPPIWRWSSRQSLAEERFWRATTAKYSGWSAGGKSGKPVEVRPERLAGLYRQLRKAQEDAKNEPGAADLYYGEMEMRRHAGTTPTAERVILWLYWLISGYGLRAFRSVVALFIVGLLTTTILLGWGLGATVPVTTPPQYLAGTIISTSHKTASINATLRGITPQLPPSSQRWTNERTWTAVEITLESLVFRSSEQPLTSAGTWITIAARIFGPVLLALSLLAVRSRVKR
jgi:hypothetical protein